MNVNVFTKMTICIVNQAFGLAVTIIIVVPVTYALAVIDIKNTFVESVLWIVGYVGLYKFFRYVLMQRSPRIRMLILLSIIAIELAAFFLLLIFNNPEK